MSTTFAELKTRLGVVLQDPNQRTFTEALVEELVLDALTEVGRIAPEQFTEDLAPTANQFTYAIRENDFSGDAIPEIELTRVEVWDASTAPESFVTSLVRADQQPGSGVGDRGWYVWGGALTLASRDVASLIGYEETYVIRVWGYSPYVPPASDDDVLAISKEVEQAIIWYVRLAAIELLIGSRDLFTQWQTRSGNTDVSPGQLLSQKSMAEAAWSRKSRAITRLRAEY